MRVLVTGGAGFVGGHVVAELNAAGARVAVVDGLSTGSRLNLADADLDDFFLADVTQATVRDVVHAWRPEVIIHLAAQASVRRSLRDPYNDARTNVLGMINVILAASSGRVRKVVVASSGGAVYGNLDLGRDRADEDT